MDRTLDARQRHVLDNLVRVRRKPTTRVVREPTRRYELDGKDCSREIISLVVYGYIAESKDGQLTRVGKPADRAAG